MPANIYIDPEAQKLLDDYRSKVLSIDIQTSTFDYFNSALNNYLIMVADRDFILYEDAENDIRDYERAYSDYESQRWIHTSGLCGCTDCHCDAVLGDLLKEMESSKSSVSIVDYRGRSKPIDSVGVDLFKIRLSNFLGPQNKSPAIEKCVSDVESLGEKWANKVDELWDIWDRQGEMFTPEQEELIIIATETDTAIQKWLLEMNSVIIEKNKEFSDNIDVWLSRFYRSSEDRIKNAVNNFIAGLLNDLKTPNPYSCSCSLEQPKPDTPPISEESPLVLDLNNDGIKTISVEKGIHFDHAGDRFAEKTGWVSAEDALLVRDINGNGKIDDGSELFGNNTLFQYEQYDINGFTALAEFDSNGDRVINKNDARWSELLLWQDKNSNGRTDEGELLTLEEAGVAGINVAYRNTGDTDENGNEHRQSGTFIREDGSVGQMNDVWFKTDSVDTEYKDKVEIPSDIKKLPNIRGWGNVPDMHQVMAMDETGRLQALLEQYLASDLIEARALVWDIILAWTGMTDVDPASYQGFNGDGRKLLAMEKLTDMKFGTIPHEYGGYYFYPYFGPYDHATLEDYFAQWESKVNSYLLLSTRYSELYKLVTDGNSAYEASGNVNAYSPLMESLRALYERDGENGKLSVSDFMNQLRRYDQKGIVCADILKRAFLDLGSADGFIRELSSGFGNMISGTDGADNLSGSVGDDILQSYDGNDTVKAGSGNDVLWGGEGDDTLIAGSGNDILYGGTGDDYLDGGSGDDIYIFGRGDGNDVVSDLDGNRPEKRNVIRLGEGIGIEDIEFFLEADSSSNYLDLVIRIKDTGDTLTIDGAICINEMDNKKNPYSIQAVTFSDGTVLEWSKILKSSMTMVDGSSYVYDETRGAIITGTSGDNRLYGTVGDDVLHGNAGNDSLFGNSGHDILRGDAGDDHLILQLQIDTTPYLSVHDFFCESAKRPAKRALIAIG